MNLLITTKQQNFVISVAGMIIILLTAIFVYFANKTGLIAPFTGAIITGSVLFLFTFIQNILNNQFKLSVRHDGLKIEYIDRFNRELTERNSQFYSWGDIIEWNLRVEQRGDDNFVVLKLRCAHLKDPVEHSFSVIENEVTEKMDSLQNSLHQLSGQKSSV